MKEESEETKQHMLAHLQELMEDWKAYGWSVVLLYHTACLQHLEQGWASWGHHATKLELKCGLLWHRVAPRSKAPSLSSQPCKQPPVATRNQRKAGPYSDPAKPGSKVCAAFSSVLITHHTRLTSMYAATACMNTVQRLCHHTEQYCKRKGF